MIVYHTIKRMVLLSAEGFGKLFTIHEKQPFVRRLFCSLSRKSLHETLPFKCNATRERYGCLLVMLCAVPFAKSSESTNRRMNKLEDIDSGNFSHHSLLRNASSAVVTSAFALVSQSMMSMNELNTLYIKELYCLIQLYDEHNAVAGRQLGTMEDDIWQEIIEARAKSDDMKRALQEVETVLTSAIEVLHSAGETAYHAGVEYSSSEAQAKCQQSREYLQLLQSESRRAEADLTKMQAKNIEKTSKNAKDITEEESGSAI